MACGTSAIWRLTATLHILFHLIETSLQIHSAFLYSMLRCQTGNDVTSSVNAYVTISTIALASCVTNMVSAVWTFKTMDFTAQRSGGIICAVLHVLQLGPLWRYFKLMVVGEKRDTEELFQVRILQVVLQNPSYIVIQVFLLLTQRQLCPEIVIGVVLSFISLIFAFTCCSHTASNSLTFVTSFESKQNDRCSCNRTVCTFSRLVSRVIRHAMMLASRLLAFTLLAHIFKAWVLLLVIGHLLIFYLTFLILSIITDNKNTHRLPIARRIPEMLLFGFIEVLDYSGRLYNSNKSVFTYYTVILLENTVMGLIWYFAKHDVTHQDALLVLIFTFFILGVIACIFSDGHFSKSRGPSLENEKEENNNIDNIESIESFQPKHQTFANKANIISDVGPSDFDLDLKDILFASSKYNPNEIGEVAIVMSDEVTHMQLEHYPSVDIHQTKNREASHEVQTSSDSGFVSRLFDNSCFENDSEGYSRIHNTSSFGSSALDATTETKETKEIPTLSSSNTGDTPQNRDTCLERRASNHLSTTTSNASDSVYGNNSNHRTRKASRYKTFSENRLRKPSSSVSHKVNNRLDCDSDTSRTSSSSCFKSAHNRLRHRRAFSRSRSVPGSRRLSSGFHQGHGLRKGTSEYYMDRGVYRTRGLIRNRSEFFNMSSSSESSSDSFFDSCWRSYSESGRSSSWSDSQSLGDFDFGFTKTWPPGRKCSIVNISDLPIEQIPVREHVVNWLKAVQRTSIGLTNEIYVPISEQYKSFDSGHPKHRFDSFRDVNITFIDSCRDVSQMSDIVPSGRYRGIQFTRSRTMSEGGGTYKKPKFLKLCGVQLSCTGKKKWLDHKLIKRFSIAGQSSKGNRIIVNKGFNSTPQVFGLESSV